MSHQVISRFPIKEMLWEIDFSTQVIFFSDHLNPLKTQFLLEFIVPLICHAFTLLVLKVKCVPSIVAWLFNLLFMVCLTSCLFQDKNLLYLRLLWFYFALVSIPFMGSLNLRCFLLVNFLNDDILSLMALKMKPTTPLPGLSMNCNCWNIK